MDERLPMVADRSRAVSLEAHAARIGAYLSAEREQRRENKGRTNSHPRAMSPRRKASRKHRPVICKTLLGVDGKPVTFDSVSAAARFVNRQPIHIRKAIKYGWECGGHTWAFQHIAVPQYANQRPVVTDQREHFPSITDAADAFDTCPENIIRAINTGGTAGKEGRRRRWAYCDEPLPREWLTNPRIADDGGPANQRAVVSD
jgi:hypothetical protein